jgi:hypothetical protein
MQIARTGVSLEQTGLPKNRLISSAKIVVRHRIDVGCLIDYGMVAT